MALQCWLVMKGGVNVFLAKSDNRDKQDTELESAARKNRAHSSTIKSGKRDCARQDEEEESHKHIIQFVIQYVQCFVVAACTLYQRYTYSTCD